METELGCNGRDVEDELLVVGTVCENGEGLGRGRERGGG